LQAERVPAGGIYDRSVRDWHHYDHWGYILKQKTPTQEGCLYTCLYDEDQLPDYSEDMCPKPLDNLSRTLRPPASTR